MEINEAINVLKKYKKIYITGPQRTGTTFAAKYLSKLIGYNHIDEHDFGTHHFGNMLRMVSESNNFVIQCPAQSHNILNFPLDDDSIIVFMIRNIYDIISSEHRIDWHTRGAANRERVKYATNFNKYSNPHIPISVIKYKVWDEVQKPKLKNYIELSYESLSKTDMWIDKEQRKNFKNKQTKE